MKAWVVTFILISVVEAQTQNCGDVGVTATFLIGIGGVPPPENVNSIEGHLGAPLSLSCIIQFLINRQGQTLSATSYNWYRNGELQSTTSSSIEIQSVGGTDGGLYECSIVTTVCTTQRSQGFTVNVGPDLRIVEPNSPSSLITEGDSFTLNCEAPGWPTPEVQWWVSGILLTEEDVFTLNSARLLDAGNYTCRAFNNVDIVNNTVEVQIMALPPTTTAEDIMTTDARLEVVYNGTADERGYYIAVGVTGGVSLMLGILSLLCCIITLYANCRYLKSKPKSKTKKKSEPYTEMPDSGGKLTGEPSVFPPPPDFSTINLAEIADSMGGGDSVVVVYKDTSVDSGDESDVDITELMKSPSEIGEIV